MLTWHQSEAGTIRDSNQERWHLEEELGLLILADGDGPAGRDLAELAISTLTRDARRAFPGNNRLAGIPTNSGNAAGKALGTPLSEILERTWQEVELARVSMAGGATSCVHLAVTWILQGCLYAATLGKAGLLASTGGALHRLDPVGMPTLAVAAGVVESPSKTEMRSQPLPAVPIYLNPVPVTVGDWVMMCSQGILVSHPISEMLPLTQLIFEDPERLTEALFRKASARYDGDDRTLVLARLLPSDITRNIHSDTIISVDIDRRFRLPLWIPLLVSAILAILVTIIGKFSGRQEE